MIEYHQPVLVERYVEGREVNVTMLGWGQEIEVLPLHEIDFAAMPAGRPRIVSYAAKWDEDHVDYAGTKPVPLRGVSNAATAEIERISLAAWHALELRDYGRVDLRVDDGGVPWVIDVNPNPDISPGAGVARAAAAAGLAYPQMVGKIAELAMRRIAHDLD
jgi:D-alanine-D-alanine ligase